MPDLAAWIERAKKELAGNESLLDMLEGEAASEMFDWGQEMAAAIASRTGGTDDAAAEEALALRLKALRQALRSIGNWAAGKYSNPTERAILKEKLFEQLGRILGDNSEDLSFVEFNEIIDSIDGQSHDPQQLIRKMKELVRKTG